MSPSQAVLIKGRAEQRVLPKSIMCFVIAKCNGTEESSREKLVPMIDVVGFVKAYVVISKIDRTVGRMTADPCRFGNKWKS